ncbi:MAG: ABC transporter ATP-binding protein [Thermoplasmata archaeon]
MEPLLKVENLKTQFVTWNGLVKALDGVSFEIMPGETLGLVGETGCGKSVTALSIMNLIPETAGTVVEGNIIFENIDLATKQKQACRIIPSKKRAKLKVKRNILKQNFKLMNQIRGNTMGMIFQEPMTTLNPVTTIKKQIVDVLYAHHINVLASRVIARKKITKTQLNDIIINVIDKKDISYLDEFINQNPELSAIKEQISYIINRHDITSFRKKNLISALYDDNKKISGSLQNLATKKLKKAPTIIPKEIKQEATRLAIELLTKVNISEPDKVINQYPHELSGGMRQRVVIAIAIASNPHLLIADEPTTALDVTIQAQILDIMKELKKTSNTSILFITHDLGVISDISDRVAVMYAGSISELGKTIDIFESPKHPYTQGLLTSIPSYGAGKGRLKSIPGTVPNLVHPPEGCKFHPRCPYAMDICKTTRPEMTDLGNGHFVACWLYSKKEGENDGKQ